MSNKEAAIKSARLKYAHFKEFMALLAGQLDHMATVDTFRARTNGGWEVLQHGELKCVGMGYRSLHKYITGGDWTDLVVEADKNGRLPDCELCAATPPRKVAARCLICKCSMCVIHANVLPVIDLCVCDVCMAPKGISPAEIQTGVYDA